MWKALYDKMTLRSAVTSKGFSYSFPVCSHFHLSCLLNSSVVMMLCLISVCTQNRSVADWCWKDLALFLLYEMCFVFVKLCTNLKISKILFTVKVCLSHPKYMLVTEEKKHLEMQNWATMKTLVQWSETNGSQCMGQVRNVQFSWKKLYFCSVYHTCLFCVIVLWCFTLAGPTLALWDFIYIYSTV